MKRTLLITFILLLVAGGLGLYLFLVDEPARVKKQKEEWKPTRIIPPNAIPKRFTFKNDNMEVKLRSAMQGQSWFMVEPMETFTEPIFTDMLTTDFLELEKESIIEISPQNLATYELDPPRAEVVYEYAIDGKTHQKRLLVGKLNYTQENYFAKIEDEPSVFLVDNKIRLFLDADLKDIRSKALFYHMPHEVKMVKIDILDPEMEESMPFALQPTMVVQRQKDEQPKWVIVDPISEPAIFDDVDAFFKSLFQTGSQTVYDAKDGDLARFGLDHPKAVISLTLSEGGQENILFGDVDREKGIIYAKNADLPEVVEVDQTRFVAMFHSHFRSAKLLEDYKPPAVTRLEVLFPKEPEKNLVINRKPGHLIFNLEDDPDFIVSRRQITPVLAPLITNPVSIIKHTPPFEWDVFGLDPPRMRIKLFENDILVMDVSTGDTIRKYGSVYTFVRDHKRNFAGQIEVDFYDNIPMEKKYFRASEDDINRAENRRRRLLEKGETE